VIGRARKRPRKKSVSFRTFWWVLIREATAHVVENSNPRLGTGPIRSWLCSSQTSSVHRLGERLLREDRGRRFWP